MPALVSSTDCHLAPGIGMGRVVEDGVPAPEATGVLAGCEAALIVLDGIPTVSDKATGIEFGQAEGLTAHRLHRIPT